VKSLPGLCVLLNFSALASAFFKASNFLALFFKSMALSTFLETLTTLFALPNNPTPNAPVPAETKIDLPSTSVRASPKSFPSARLPATCKP